MADKRITDLPLILSGDISTQDVLPIVDVALDITNKITVDQLKSYINSGNTDFYVTGGTYSGGTLTLDANGKSFNAGASTIVIPVTNDNKSYQFVWVDATATLGTLTWMPILGYKA